MSTLITPPFRISFPSLIKATGYQGSAEKFSVTALWYTEDVKGKYKVTWGNLIKRLDETAREFFQTPLAKLPANIRRGIRNGTEKAHLNGYGSEVLFASLSANADRRPQVVDLRKNLLSDDQIRQLCYPGAWARASVNVYAYDNIGKGVAIGLNNLQWLGHGDRLDSVTDAKQDFEDDPEDIWFQQEAESADPTENAVYGATEADKGPPDNYDDDIPF
ncbi:MAG: DUF2815 family protein [Proteobacteria bacterium]|nr:DUF2815 family protein [Pseudomonadota bacterium]